MKKTIVLAIVLALAGCGTPGPVTTPSPHAIDKQAINDPDAFLPAYVEMLQGKRPWPRDDSCPADLATLMLADCDRP